MTNSAHDSLWWATLPEELKNANRPTLAQEIELDVVIVGAGFTGLWTAYYLKQKNPSLSVAIVESQYAGFGASGRNGGWCSALFPTSIEKLAKLFGPEAALAMQDAMHATITEIESVVVKEQIDCDWERGGTVVLARTALQLERAKQEVAEWHSWGYGIDDYSFLDKGHAKDLVNATNILGATFTSHCASIHPAKLVRTLANIVERMGVTIYENTAATTISPQLVQTEFGAVKAKYVVRATEGFTSLLPKQKRVVAPIYSLMIATEPIPESVWETIGLRNRETFSDHRNLIIYGQRTADNRIAFGGRGAPYHFGSKIDPAFDVDPQVQNGLFDVLTEMFPVLSKKKVTHSWGGPLGVSRDWMPSCGLDEATGLAWAGGYVGDGVATSNLAGRTLSELITKQSSDLISLPWVNHNSPKWELEPLRWIGANAGLRVMTWADKSENRNGKASRLANLTKKFLGN